MNKVYKYNIICSSFFNYSTTERHRNNSILGKYFKFVNIIPTLTLQTFTDCPKKYGWPANVFSCILDLKKFFTMKFNFICTYFIFTHRVKAYWNGEFSSWTIGCPKKQQQRRPNRFKAPVAVWRTLPSGM